MMSAPSAPPRPASPLPRAKVSVKSWRVSIPTDCAMPRLSTAARTIAPQRVRSTPNHSAAISAALNTDRKSTRLNSSHITISYAVFCLKKKKKTNQDATHPHNNEHDYPSPNTTNDPHDF